MLRGIVWAPVGTLLQNKMKRPLLIYGYEGCNVNAQNLVLAYDMVKSYAPGKNRL